MSSHDSRVRDYPTYLGSDRKTARFLSGPVDRFMHLELASGVLMLIATVVALVWVNSPAKESYYQLWETELNLEIGAFHLQENLLEFVNGGLMAIFFFVVGMEIKRELVVGELRDPRKAAVPAIAAIGGMVVPAAIYFAFNNGGAVDGWGIPMATDIAFAVGIVALLGSRVPAPLKLFLLTLAIVDDIGAIVVIAIFYTDQLAFDMLAYSVVAILSMTLLRYLKVWNIGIYVILGVIAWYFMLESGIHATIAGVVIGLLTPARPLLSRVEAEAIADDVEDDPTPQSVRYHAFLLRESVPVVNRLEAKLHPYTSYLIIPIFALANAGVAISGESVSAAISSPVTQGVALGLVIGKPVGVLLFSWIATKLGLKLPANASWPQMASVGMAAGIGFTVAIFVTGLAFPGAEDLQDSAKIGILAASAVASVLTILMFRATCKKVVEPAHVEVADDEHFDEAITSGETAVDSSLPSGV
jgi:Na+:H+ antiporter, NhaA family